MSIQDVPDVVYDILDAHGYHRTGAWHDPDSTREVCQEMEDWAEHPDKAPGGCTGCRKTYDPPLPEVCTCGEEVESILALVGLEKED